MIPGYRVCRYNDATMHGDEDCPYERPRWSASRIAAGVYVQMSPDSRTAWFVSRADSAWVGELIESDTATDGTTLLFRDDDGRIVGGSRNLEDWYQAELGTVVESSTKADVVRMLHVGWWGDRGYPLSLDRELATS